MKRQPRDRRCTYLVTLDHHIATLEELQDLAEYLSLVAISDFDVVVVDASPQRLIDRNRRVLRWVARYVASSGPIDPVRAAIDVAACQKVIVADHRVRYCQESLDVLCGMLDIHEVVEAQEYLEPMPWWGGLDAGRMLVHRAIDPLPDRGSTFGFRRSSVRGLRSLEATLPATDHVRRLASQGAEVFTAAEVFVRRIPPEFDDWLRARPAEADADFAMPARSIFFLSLLPMLAALLLLGGAHVAGGYAGAIAFCTVALAFRGRSGASSVFPVRACLLAPVWVLERSISVYWAVLRRLSADGTPDTAGSAAGFSPRPEVRETAL
jgi:hypothetical protein